MRQVGATLHHGARASHYRGLLLQSTGPRLLLTCRSNVLSLRLLVLIAQNGFHTSRHRVCLSDKKGKGQSLKVACQLTLLIRQIVAFPVNISFIRPLLAARESRKLNFLGGYCSTEQNPGQNSIRFKERGQDGYWTGN